MVKIGVKLLAALALAIGVIEVSFRLAGALAGWDRGTSALTRSHDVVLCVGDSHTWGLGRGYPARLGERLAERGKSYRVINMGVPGSNTAQVRKRLDDYLERFQPRVVILWAGVNNKYNRADTEVWQEAGVHPPSPLRSLLDSSRFLRFLRLWQNDRVLDRYLDGAGTYVRPDDNGGGKKVAGEERFRFQRSLMGETDVFDHVRGDYLPGDEVSRVTELDVRAIIAKARARDVPIVVVTYPIEGGWFHEANLGIRAAASALGAPIVESPQVLQRLKADSARRGEKADKRRFFDQSVHPQQLLYDAIADAVLQTVDAQRLLGDGASARDGSAVSPAATDTPSAAGPTGG